MDNALNIVAESRAFHAITSLEYAHQDNARTMNFIVEYDSMAPTVKNGDMVAIDTSVIWWVKDGIYLVNFPNQGPAIPASQLLRRVIRLPFQDRYKIVCDNPAYEAVEVDGDLLDLAGLAVEVFSHKRL